jgi:hypothetical protein
MGLDDEMRSKATRIVAELDKHLDLAADHFGSLGEDVIPEGSVFGWYGSAFHYMLREPDPPANAENAFAPMLETTTGVYPPPVADVPPEAQDLWELGAVLTTHPAAAARLHHLCFAARIGDRGAHLRAAADAYLTLGGRADVDRLSRVKALRWALELSALMRDEARVSAVLDALVEVAEAGMLQGPKEPGVALRAISAMAKQKRDDPRLPSLLDKAEGVYTGAPHVSRMAELRRLVALGDRDEVARVNRVEAERWLDEALAGVSGLADLGG